MGMFLVSYDLIDGKNYDRIIKELERLGAVRTQLSSYLTDVTAERSTGLLQHLKNFVDADDRLMVIKITEKPAHTIGLKGTQAWIDGHFN